MDSPTSARPLRWPWVMAGLLLTLYFISPPREVYDASLDRSNYATYAHFLTHGFQWGVDVLPMAGPYGFVLFGYCYSGELFFQRWVGDFLLCAGFSALLLGLFHRAQAGMLRWLWLGVMLLVVPFIDDLLLDATLLLSGICLLLGPAQRPDRWAYLGAVLLAFISLVKGTQFMSCAVVFGCVTLLGILERQPGRVLRPAAVFLGAALCFWVLAGQNPLNLPAHLIATWQLASGYNLSMGLEEDRFFFQVGLFLAGGLAVVLGWTAWWGVRSLRAGAALAFISLFAFLKWKHGYVRADGHVYIFYGSAAIIAMTGWLVGFSSLVEPVAVLPRSRARVGLALITLVTAFGIIGCTQFWLGRFGLVARSIPGRLSSHADYLVRPREARAKLDQELAQVRVDADLPQVRNEIGRGTVDFFGIEEGVLLLNGLNYHPRPMGGGTFNVVNRWLARRNESFLLSPDRAPAWELLKLGPIDERLPSGDDGLALRAILDCYSPVLMQRDYLLLKRVRDRPATAIPQLLKTITARPSQPVMVPDPGPGRLVLMSLRAPLNLAGQLRTTVYRPPVLRGRFFTTHYPAGRTFELKPATLSEPIILSPLLESTADILQLYGSATGNTVKSLVLDAAPGFATDKFSISFYAVPRPSQPTDTDLSEILTYDKHPLYNREPVEIITQQTGITELSKEPITLVHAPGSITWNLEPTDQQVIFSYGLMPKAYLDGGTTDGVEFNVEVLWPPSDGRVIFKQMLRPLTTIADRGMHRARVLLPPFEPGARLRIRTHPGPDNDGAYDQSYISRVNIKAGPLEADQFSGLGLIPTDRRLPHGSVASVNNQPVFLLHAPNELTLDLPEGAKLFRAEIGLLPSAYTNGGASDGVEFTLFVVPPIGPRQSVWVRYVDPVQKPTDRGSLVIAIPLPAVPPGSHVVITTGIGPNGNRSWDQSYISHAAFE
jgi:hypothetical protein